MGIKTRAFNPAEMLQSDAEIAGFLAEAYADEDPATFVSALGAVVKLKGVAKMAEETGLNRESLYKSFSGKAQPKWDTVHRLLKAIGVKLSMAA
jgi:probable addiction module antidote protein